MSLNIKVLSKNLYNNRLNLDAEGIENLLQEIYDDGKEDGSILQEAKDKAEFLNPQPHYDNSNGSLYKFAEDHKLNAWEFDIVKRIVRSRKKGQFKEDLQKTKDVIDIYLREYEGEG